MAWTRNNLRAFAALTALALAGAGVWWMFRAPPGPRDHRPLPHHAYVWQRSWDGRVQAAIRQHHRTFQSLIVLAAEVSWAQGRPVIAQAQLDYPFLRSLGRPLGLALRIGPYAGPFTTNDPTALGLAQLAAAVVQTAQTNGLEVAELHVDFDCAESRLAGYRNWLVTFRRQLAPLQPAAGPPIGLTLTALPAWLKHRAFAELVRATDGYVLQVHSLERPRSVAEPFVLCEPRAAQRWVEQAARAAVPFRVALPTYGYQLAFDRRGRFLGLNADGPEKIFSPDSIRREVRSDPAAMAELVREWGSDRPTALRGIIWYRLPVVGERLNWSWPTMSEVIAGRNPRSQMFVSLSQPQPGLTEFYLTNAGPGDYVGTPILQARWSEGRPLAADALRGFRLEDPAAGRSLDFIGEHPLRLPAGASRPVGWLRTDPGATVTAELTPPPP